MDGLLANGCTTPAGRSSGVSEDMFIRTILGYACHPMVACAVMLEHGCEKTHNEKMAGVLAEMGEDVSQWGFSSIQLDGGIEKVSGWFARPASPHVLLTCAVMPLRARWLEQRP